MAIIAAFGPSSTKTYTKSLYQYDKGQKLIITGAKLPAKFKLHISNDKEYGVASSFSGKPEGTMIPDEFFMSGQYVYVWVCEVPEEQIPDETEESTETNNDESMVKECTTVYEIVIPVIRKPG